MMNEGRHRLFKPEKDEQTINIDNINDGLDEGDYNSILSLTDNIKNSYIEIGQTYFGQMIAHDIVPSTNLFKNRQKISPSLNLHSLYGDKHNPAHFNKHGQFILGYAIDSETDKELPGEDLLRGKEGQALIPDGRNDENIIISQLHLFWQKLHNKINDDLRKKFNFKEYFEITKDIVVKLFHEIMIHDHLSQILHPDVYVLYFCDESDFYFHYHENVFNEIPIEFSRSVFRFGHSMIRDTYQLNTKPNVDNVRLENILSNRDLYLKSDSIINWGLFFTSSQLYRSPYHPRIKLESTDSSEFASTRQTAKIDTKIVKALKEVPFLEGELKDIRGINLTAGLSDDIKINSGESIRLALKRNNVFEELLTNEFYDYKSLKVLPLWPYILKEAELNSQIAGQKGHGLGPVGSIITAEVLKASIETATLNETGNFNVAYQHIKSLLKESQMQAEKKLPSDLSECQLNEFINKSPITMGYCVNYIN